jgi:hypothetical protein
MLDGFRWVTLRASEGRLGDEMFFKLLNPTAPAFLTFWAGGTFVPSVIDGSQSGISPHLIIVH